MNLQETFNTALQESVPEWPLNSDWELQTPILMVLGVGDDTAKAVRVLIPVPCNSQHVLHTTTLAHLTTTTASYFQGNTSQGTVPCLGTCTSLLQIPRGLKATHSTHYFFLVSFIAIFPKYEMRTHMPTVLQLAKVLEMAFLHE